MKNIVLIGFMGSGKTSVSKILSRKLKWKTEDLDRNIVKKAGKPITRIFAEHGEKYFRKMETLAAVEAGKRKKRIIAAGGGIVTKKKSVAALKKSGTVIFLKNSFETSEKRLRGKTDRPLFKDLKKAKAIFNLRRRMYREAADITIVTDNRDTNEVAGEILKKVKERGDV